MALEVGGHVRVFYPTMFCLPADTKQVGAMPTEE